MLAALVVIGSHVGIDSCEELRLRGHHKELEGVRSGSQGISSHSFLRVAALFLYRSFLARVIKTFRARFSKSYLTNSVTLGKHLNLS